MYRRLLNIGTEEAKEKYKEAKIEANRVVRSAKNEEWVQFGRVMEKDVSANPRRFWDRVNCRSPKDSMNHICDENGQVLVDEADVIERWKEHFKGLFGVEEGSCQDMRYSEVVTNDDREITLEEVRKGVKKLKLRMAPGVCGVLP